MNTPLSSISTKEEKIDESVVTVKKRKIDVSSQAAINAQSKSRFEAILTENEVTLVGSYVSNCVRVECICKNGHVINVLPKSVKSRGVSCATCIPTKTAEGVVTVTKIKKAVQSQAAINAESRSSFEAILKENEVTLVGKYVSNGVPVKCMCKNAHMFDVLPKIVKRFGRVSCPTCITTRSNANSKKYFEQKLTEQDVVAKGVYKSTNESIDCFCNKCQTEIRVLPKLVKRTGGIVCYGCNGRSTTHTAKKDFYKAIEKLGGKVVGEYKTAKHKVECICPQGHTCYPEAGKISTFVDYKGMCTICRGYDFETNKKLFREMLGMQDIIVVGEYVNVNTKILCQCKESHSFEVSLADLKRRKTICDICGAGGAETRFMEILTSKGITLIGKYEGGENKIECKCSKGHSSFFSSPANIHITKNPCPTCNPTSFENVDKNFQELVASLGGITKGVYKNNRTRVECICSKGHKCFPVPDRLQISQILCRTCHVHDHVSVGEKKVTSYLNKHKIDYLKEHTFSFAALKRYDFVCDVKVSSGLTKKCIIEYDGEQHFVYTPFFHDDHNNFLKKQNVDRVKTLLALANGYSVLRIHHSDKVNDCIQSFMSKLNDKTGELLWFSTPSKYTYFEFETDFHLYNTNTSPDCQVKPCNEKLSDFLILET
jgi:very-short-patch-repair endonuclease